MEHTRSIDPIIHAFGEGKLVVLFDDSEEGSGAYLCQEAGYATEESVNFVAVHARGVMCAGLLNEVADRLELTPMPGTHDNPAWCGFTISVEARQGVSTGISASDRAKTLQVLGDPGARGRDWVSPGHIFPVRVHPAGILGRSRVAEAAAEMSRISGGVGAGLFCAILDDAGHALDPTTMIEFCEKHGLLSCSFNDVKKYRLQREFFVEQVDDRMIDTAFGRFRMLMFVDGVDGSTHPVFVRGDLSNSSAPLARIHSQCLTGDGFQSLRCDCGEQLDVAMRAISQEGTGIVVYLRQEGRGIGLTNKVRAYHLQDQGRDTVDANLDLGFDADERSYVLAAQIFRTLGLRSVRLMTNNTRKVEETEQWGVKVTERIPIEIPARPENAAYLETKRQRMGHKLQPSDTF